MMPKTKITTIREKFKNSKFNRNTAPKLLSLLFAIMLWLVVIDLENPEIEKNIENVPVMILNEADVTQNGLIVLDRADYYVDVKVKGRRDDVLGVKSSDIRVSADLRGFKKGVNSVPLDKRIYSENVVITDLSQSEIKIVLDQIIEIPKPVAIQIEGNVPAGYTKDDISVAPQEILVRGPESIVNTVAKVYGDLNITDSEVSISKEIPVKPIDNDGNIVNGVTLGKDYVATSVAVYKLKKVPIVYKTTGEIPSDYRLVDVELLTSSVTIKGEKSVIDGIESVETTPIDVNKKTNSFTDTVDLIMPENVETPMLENDIKAKVNIEKMTSKEFRIKVREVPIYNLNSNYTTDIDKNEEFVKITLFDVESKLSKINIEILNPIIDGSHFKVGVNGCKIEIDNAIEVEKYEVNPSVIYLDIKEKTTN